MTDMYISSGELFGQEESPDGIIFYELIVMKETINLLESGEIEGVFIEGNWYMLVEEE